MDYRTGKCSQCGAEYKIPASFAHNQARCKECGGVVHIGAKGSRRAKTAGAPAPGPALASPPAPRPKVEAPSPAPAPALAGAAAQRSEERPREPEQRLREPQPGAPPAPAAHGRERKISPLVAWLVAAALAAAGALVYFRDAIFT